MVLSVENLAVAVRGDDGVDHSLIAGIDVAVARGRTTALVGASGAGKSLTAYCVLDLLPRGLRRTSGRIALEGRPVTTGDEFAAIRGRRVGMIFQDPRVHLNPSFRVGHQLVRVLRAHRRMTPAEADTNARSWLERVGFDDPDVTFHRHPHRLSGGQCQRVMIAMALAHEPALLIADEPTSNLDVQVQGRILGLIRRLQREVGMGLLLITHDRRVVKAMADDVWTMEPGGPTRHEGGDR